MISSATAPRWMPSLWRICITVILTNIAMLFLALDDWLIRQVIGRAISAHIFGV